MHNVNGIGKTTRGLRHFGPDVHVVLLQETHVKEDDVPPEIKGFKVVHAHAAPNTSKPEDRGKRGLLFAINESLGATTRTTARTPNVLLHEVKLGDITLILGNVYVPHDRRRVRNPKAKPQDQQQKPGAKPKRQTAEEKVNSEDDERRLAVFEEIDNCIAEQVAKTPNAVWVLAGDFNPSTDGIVAIRRENQVLQSHNFKSWPVRDAADGKQRSTKSDAVFTRNVHSCDNVNVLSNWENSSHFMTGASDKRTDARVSDHHTLTVALELKGLVTARRRPKRNFLSDGVTPVMGWNQALIAQGLMGMGANANSAYQQQAKMLGQFQAAAMAELTAAAGDTAGVE